jgi:putative membrane-bound dehydrogenase-like protein
VALRPRPSNFGDLDQHLHYFKADLIIAAFGYNESFAGQRGLTKFEKDLNTFLTNLKSKAYNGKTAPQIILISPASNENTQQVKALDRNNANLALYSKALASAAQKHKVGFADILNATNKALYGTGPDWTTDGHQYNIIGHSAFSKRVYSVIFNEPAPAINEPLRQLVIDKATQFHYRYRPLNTFYYVGGRNKTYGYLDFLPAMRNFDLMVENRDKAIHATAATGKSVKPNDSNLPKLDPVKLARGANKFLSPADELKAFKVDPRFEVNCFASEEDFPELACPISMRWDTRGRLWVSTSVSYPHIYPGQKPVDKIIILEDTDWDGKADKCTTWANDLHIPLSFVLDGSGGVYCSEQPHLTHLTDRDGDGKMDHREIISTGYGCEDSHHSIHDFAWTPGGDLVFRESIFHHSQMETPYGPVRARNSSWFLYTPSKRKLTAFGSYPNTNPWGITFDKWGNHVASHPVFASTFHATNPDYPTGKHNPSSGFAQEPGQHPKAAGMQAYSGVCGHGFVDFPQWPKEMQGGFIKNRYKPTNNVEFHTWTEKEDHFAEEKKFNLIFSSNLSFIPVDFNFGPRGAGYICDWYNPVKGHAQYSLRDPRRDRKAGRIWRIVPKGFKPSALPKISGASIPELLDLLKSDQYSIRELAKLELRKHGKKIMMDTPHGKTMAIPLKLGLDLAHSQTKDSTDRHLLENLWVYQMLDTKNIELLEKLINSDNHLVAASAFGPLRFWHNQIDETRVAKLLHAGAVHPSQHVRREAVICASYIGTPKAFIAVKPVLDQPAGTHLAYAIRSSFNSAALKPHWTSDTKARLDRLGKQTKVTKQKLTPEDRKFDRRKNLATRVINCVPERIMFDKTTIKVKAGQPVKLTLNNPDATQHNLLILEKGTPLEEIGMAANEMAKDPEAAKKGYIPDDKRILHHTRLLAPLTSQTLRFTAPKKPGKYPYVCTFPGHWTVMKGVMIVE